MATATAAHAHPFVFIGVFLGVFSAYIGGTVLLIRKCVSKD